MNLKESSEARLWFLNLAGLLAAMLLGSLVGATLAPFPWLLLSRLLVAGLLAILPPLRGEAYRPYLLCGSGGTLLLAQVLDARELPFYLAILGLYLLVDPSLDVLLARSPEEEWLGRASLLLLSRSAGLLLGVLAATVLTPRPVLSHAFYSAALLALTLLLALLREGEQQPRTSPFCGLVAAQARAGHKVLFSSSLVLLCLAVMMGSLRAGLFPIAFLSPVSLRQWLSEPENRLAAGMACAAGAFLLQRFSRQTLRALCYSAVVIALAVRLAWPQEVAVRAAFEVAAGIALLVAYRHTLAVQSALPPALKAALPVSLWAAGMLAGQTLATLSPSFPLLLVRLSCALVVTASLALTWRHWRPRVRVIPRAVASDTDPQGGQSRHGDKKFDYTAVPEPKRKKRSRWLARLWYDLVVRFPVTLTLALLVSFLLAAAWRACDEKKAWSERTTEAVTAMKTQLFLTSLKHRLEEEMLASSRVPDDWGDFVAVNFELDGRPMKDTDFWGTPLRFEVLPKEVRIASAGPDKKHHTPDDLERSAHRPDGVVEK
jgi:hypothetical protein